jgi:hypothetical protein
MYIFKNLDIELVLSTIDHKSLHEGGRRCLLVLWLLEFVILALFPKIDIFFREFTVKDKEIEQVRHEDGSSGLKMKKKERK